MSSEPYDPNKDLAELLKVLADCRELLDENQEMQFIKPVRFVLYWLDRDDQWTALWAGETESEALGYAQEYQQSQSCIQTYAIERHFQGGRVQRDKPFTISTNLPVIDCTIPDNSDDPAYWTYCFMKQYEARFIDATVMLDWFTRCLAAGRKQAQIDNEVANW